MQAAVVSLRAAIDGRPEWARAHFVLGSALLIGGDHNGARAELARALELDPSIADARRVLSQVHAALGEHEYAIEQGREYLRVAPGNNPTRILVAQSLVRLGRPDEAMRELELIPEDERAADALYALGRLQVAKGDLKGARDRLIAADQGKPNHPDILRTLLGIERRLGMLDQSADRIRKAVKEEPEKGG